MGKDVAGFEGGGDLLGSSTVVGLFYGDVAAGVSAYEGSPPIPGVVRVTEIGWRVGRLSSGTGMHRLQLGVASDVPATAGEMDAAEQLFPHASSEVGGESELRMYSIYASFRFSLDRLLFLNGRRIVGRFESGAASGNGDFYVYLIVHRVDGVGHRIESFLAGGGSIW